MDRQHRKQQPQAYSSSSSSPAKRHRYRAEENSANDVPSPPEKKARESDFETILRRSESQVEEDEEDSTRMDSNRSEDKLFNDCIHKTIRVPLVVAKIMDTPQFQRLRSIKQTGTCHLVYPNATHNRFQHSLGVAHLAEKFAKQLKEIYDDLLDEKDILCVMIAGLCHDLGHGPYSHLWESFVTEANPNAAYHHEDTSIKMIDRLLDENHLRPILLEKAGIGETDIIFIKEMIAGPLDPATGLPSGVSPNAAAAWPYRGRGEEKSFLFEIVANKQSGIDVDKWDYFLRDDYYMKIGHVFDYERFIKFCRVEKTGNPCRRRIIMREKEAENIVEMYRDRTRLHSHGYQHKITKIADRMLLDAWLMADPYVSVKGSSGQRFKLSEASVKDVGAHEKLVDEFVHYLIMESEDVELQPAQELLRRILRRDLYFAVSQVNVLGEEKLEKLSNSEILRNIQQFFTEYAKHHKSSLTPEDFTLARTSVTLGIDINQVGFYFYGELKQQAISFTSAKSLQLCIPDQTQQERVIILCKRRELGQEAMRVIKKWKKDRGLKMQEENGVGQD